MAPRKKVKQEDGFTLIELLVVILVIGILASIAVPVFLNQRKKGFESSLKSDLKNLGTSMETSLVNNKGVYPDSIPSDFKVSSGNILKLTTEAGNTNISAGSQGVSQGRVGQYHTGGSPTRVTKDGYLATSYAGITGSTYGGSYWDYVPNDPGGIKKGSAFTGSITVRSSEDTCLYARFEQRVGGSLLGSVNGSNVCVVANTWTELKVSGATTIDTELITLTAYSTHQPESTFDYKDQMIVFGSSINKDQVAIGTTQKYCVQGYHESDKGNIWHYSVLNGGVEQGSC